MMYEPGNRIPQDGVYEVSHRCHRQTHNVIFSGVTVFPHCDTCGAEVRFRLLLGATLLEDDEDFR